MKTTVLALLLTVPSLASAETRQFRAQMFCNEVGDYANQALVDYRNGMSEDMALKRVDGYICVDACKAREEVLRDTIRFMYDRLSSSEFDVRKLDSAVFMQVYEQNRILAVSRCMNAAQ